jgi:hypothetical protein
MLALAPIEAARDVLPPPPPPLSGGEGAETGVGSIVECRSVLDRFDRWADGVTVLTVSASESRLTPAAADARSAILAGPSLSRNSQPLRRVTSERQPAEAAVSSAEAMAGSSSQPSPTAAGSTGPPPSAWASDNGGSVREDDESEVWSDDEDEER